MRFLAIMSLEQFIQAHSLKDPETDQFKFGALRIALQNLALADIQILVISENPQLLQTFIVYAKQSISVLNTENFDSNASILASVSITDPVMLVREAHRHIAPTIAVSFFDSLQQIDEFEHLNFHNPGRLFQHYHAWIESQVPIHPCRRKLLMSVGELVPQDQSKIVEALSLVYQRVKTSNSISLRALIAKIGALIAEQETEPNGHIYRLKMGFLEENLFDARMIESLREQTGIVFTTEEFNQIWQATNPDYAQIQERLARVNMKLLREHGFDFECVGFTNIKDMRHLLEELQAHDAAYVLAKGQLVGFAGLRLSCSFIEQKTRVEMLADAVKYAGYGRSFLDMQSSAQARTPATFFVSSGSDLSEIQAVKGMNALPNWDGSPLHIWAELQVEAGLSHQKSVEQVL